MPLRSGLETDLAWVNARYTEIGFRLSTDSDLIVVAEEDGILQAAGRVVLTEADCGELGGIYVAPEHRGKSLAQAIVGDLVGRYGSTPLFCLPFTQLRHFYERFGFSLMTDSDSVPTSIRDKWRWCNQHYDAEVLLMFRPATPARFSK